MPKRAKELTDRQVKALVRKAVIGFHSVGGTGSAGLAVQIKSENSASWVLRIGIDGRRRDMGLGNFYELTLAEARDLARDIRKKVNLGVDPINERKELVSARRAAAADKLTFRDVAKQYVAKKRSDFQGKNVAQRILKLETQLEKYIFPAIGAILPADIKRAHIEQILEPIWFTKTETANRVRLTIEKVLDLAIVLELRSMDNPARWKGYLDHIFPKPSKVAATVNHAALKVELLPEFISKLRSNQTVPALILEFQILTAARPGEARAARWDQIDFESMTWRLKTSDMKEGKEHIVPLCSRLQAILEAHPKIGELIFPNPQGRQYSDVSVSKLAKSIMPGITCHGFRSTFKDWARVHAKQYTDEVSELALAHVASDSTRAAYARDMLVDERRRLMQDFQRFCEDGPVSGDVIPLEKRG